MAADFRIYKYTLVPTDHQQISMPAGAQILCVQMQHGQPCLWAKVDALSKIATNRNIYVVGTGNPMPKEAMVYIGTFQMYDGALVWHVFTDL